MSASPSPSWQQVGKQPHQWFSLHLLFLGEAQSEGDVRGCIQISEALSMHQGIYCPGHWDTSQGPSPGQELSSPLRVDSSLWRSDSAGQHSNAISLCGFVLPFQGRSIPRLQSPLHLAWVTRISHSCCWNTQFQSFHMPPSQKRFFRCQILRKLSRISMAWSRGGLGRGHRRVSAKIPQNIPC